MSLPINAFPKAAPPYCFCATHGEYIGEIGKCPKCKSPFEPWSIYATEDRKREFSESMQPRKVTHRWADYAFDECAYCGVNMGVFADTYEFNLHFMDCPSCGKRNMSGYIDSKFVWRRIEKVQFPDGSPSTEDIMGTDGAAGSKGVR